MQAHERVQQEQLWAHEVEGRHQTPLVLWEVQAQDGDGDDGQIEGEEIQAAMETEGLDAGTDGGKTVLGEVDEGGSGVVDGEAVQARRGGSDAGG